MERKTSIDLLRIFSAMAVVAIHTVSGPVANHNGILATELTETLQSVHNLLNWSVPVFFMITGYCIIRKKEYSYRQCFLHISKYIVVLFTVGLAYAILEEVALVKTVSISLILKSVLNVITGNLWDHMWYIYTVIGIYLVLPVIHSFMQSQKQNRFILTGLLFLFTIALPSFEPWITVGVDFPFGGYLFYVCFGGMIAKDDLNKKINTCIFVLGIISTVYVACNLQTYDYRSIPICMMAISIFTPINATNIKSSKLFMTVSQCTWGIYLIHPLFINISIKVLNIDLLSKLPYIHLTIFYLILCVISFGATYVLRKTPIIQKIF